MTQQGSLDRPLPPPPQPSPSSSSRLPPDDGSVSAAFLPGSHTRQASQGASSIAQLRDAEEYIPGLTTNLFGAIPAIDPLSTLLSRHIPANARPARDVSGDPRGRSLPELISTKSWRALAVHAELGITQCPPDHTSTILELWVARLTALHHLRLPLLYAYEISNLFSVLPEPYASPIAPYKRPPLDTKIEPFFHPSIPFALIVLRANTSALSGKPEQTVEALWEVAEGCKREFWRARRQQGQVDLWQRRLNSVSVLISDTLVSMQEYANAALVLEGVLSTSDDPQVASALARLHARSGYLGCISLNNVDLQTRIIERIAVGDLQDAEKLAREGAAAASGDGPAINNLAVVLIQRGKLVEATRLLSDLAGSAPAFVFNSETAISNLATALELGGSGGKMALSKFDLLAEGARWAGDGLAVGCFKL